MCATPSVPQASWYVSGMGPWLCLCFGLYVGAVRSLSSRGGLLDRSTATGIKDTLPCKEPLVNKPKDVWWGKVMEVVNHLVLGKCGMTSC